MTLVPVDTSSEVAVTSYLQQARDWLTRAVDETGPEQIAAAKAEIATAAEATKQLGLSKEIQLDALEMVRRAEYALGKAIRRGQAEGTVYAPGKNPGPQRDYERNGRLVRGGVAQSEPSSVAVTDLASRSDLYNSKGNIMDLAVAEPAHFDAAIESARAEGNLSRANVARKVKGQAAPTSRDQRADLIAELAAQGYSSRQMPSKVGVTEESVRQIARDYDIDIPADRSIGRTRRINSTDVVVNTATALEGLVSGVELIDYQAVDPAVASQWIDSLTDSLRVLNRCLRQIKETIQ